jgi:predicted site-specific integrase-resolvase
VSPHEEMIQDLVSIVHVFSCRIYGLRKYKDKINNDSELNAEKLGLTDLFADEIEVS